MKRILLALLCVVALGAVSSTLISTEKEVSPLYLNIDSEMSAEHQTILIELLVWIDKHMPEQIEDGVRKHQISVFILDLGPNGLAGADWNREGNEPLYKIVVDLDFFTELSLAYKRSILIHELEHLNLYSQGYKGLRTPCTRALHEKAALGAELQYSLHTGIVNTSRFNYLQVEMERAKTYLAVKCPDFKYK